MRNTAKPWDWRETGTYYSTPTPSESYKGCTDRVVYVCNSKVIYIYTCKLEKPPNYNDRMPAATCADLVQEVTRHNTLTIFYRCQV